MKLWWWATPSPKVNILWPLLLLLPCCKPIISWKVLSSNCFPSMQQWCLSRQTIWSFKYIMTFWLISYTHKLICTSIFIVRKLLLRWSMETEIKATVCWTFNLVSSTLRLNKFHSWFLRYSVQVWFFKYLNKLFRKRARWLI